jgi:hypothetical protein
MSTFGLTVAALAMTGLLVAKLRRDVLGGVEGRYTS